MLHAGRLAEKNLSKGVGLNCDIFAGSAGLQESLTWATEDTYYPTFQRQCHSGHTNPPKTTPQQFGLCKPQQGQQPETVS